jgi:ArsR family transcriptional regulator, arsenate/arsenite/antimonite-responsive transcriptional repressor
MTTPRSDVRRRSDASAGCRPSAAAAARKGGASLVTPAADAELAAFAKAIGHPVRVRILRMLARRKARMCSHIVDELPLAQSTVSEHLRILRASGLITADESSPRAGYCIAPAALLRLKALLDAV